MANKDKILIKAQRYALKGSIDKAIKEYKKIVEVDPQDVIVRLRLGELYARMGKKEEAIEEYSEVADVQSRRGFFLKAIAVYKQILKIDGSNIDVYLKVGELYEKQGLLADALSQYSRVVERYEREGSYDEAINVMKNMMGIAPNNMTVKARLAATLYERGLVEDAFVEFEAVAQKFIENGDSDKAETIYKKFLKDGVEEIRALQGLSKVYSLVSKNGALLETYKGLLKLYKNKGLEKESKDICGEILELDPQDEDALEILGKGKPAVPHIIPETGKEEDEEIVDVLPEEYVDLVAELGLDEETPSEPDAGRVEETVEETSKDGELETHYYMGVAYMGTGLLDEAIKELKIATDLPKVVFDSYVRIGLCYMRQKEPRQAIKYFEMGLKIPRNARDKYGLFYEIGLAYEVLGEREKALKFFKEIEKEDKDFREVRKKIETFS